MQLGKHFIYYGTVFCYCRKHVWFYYMLIYKMNIMCKALFLDMNESKHISVLVLKRKGG